MCIICSEFRPYNPDCVYADIETTYAQVPEVVTSPASIFTTNTMLVDDVFLGTLETLGDDDWIAVTLTGGTSYEIEMMGADSGTGTLSDPYLRLYNSAGSQVAFNDDGGMGRDSRMVFTPVSSGTFYISARAWSDGATGTYQITLAENVPAPLGTLAQLAAYLTDGYWNSVNRARHSFDTTLSNEITVDISALDQRGQALALMAMEAWEAVADITFSVRSGNAQITFTDDQSGAFASYSAIGANTQSATVNISTTWLNTYGTGYDDYSFSTYVHELGHALGLGHQGPYNGSATYGSDEAYSNDSYQLSVMSYFSQSENTTIQASYALPLTAMAADILAMQDLYGAPGSSSQTAGDTVYGVGQTVGGYLGDFFNILTTGQDPNNMYSGGPVAITLYDHSGIDLVDFSTDISAQYVDLDSLGIWNAFGLTGNVIVASGTVLEHYRAGQGNDTIHGNSADNDLRGNGGDDTLFGEGGNDTLDGGTGADRMEGGAGNDTYRVDNAGDVIVETAGNGVDHVESSVSLALRDHSQHLETLTLLGGGDIDGTGNGRHNTITGNAGHNVLNGAWGNDTLDGGAGADTFVFSNGADVIQHFENDIDTIRVANSYFGGGLTAQQFLDTYADDSSGTTIIDLGNGNSLTVNAIANRLDLVDDIVFV
jgi:serralysin